MTADSTLQRRPTDFAHRNLLLQALLGLRAWSGRLDQLLEAHAPAGRVGEAAPSDETLTYAILGAIAFRSRLGSHLAAVAREAEERASSEPAPDPEPPPRGLLR